MAREYDDPTPDDSESCDECGSTGTCHPNCSFVLASSDTEALDQASAEDIEVEPPVLGAFEAFVLRCALDCINAREDS